MAGRSHLFPFRTQPLSFPAPRIVKGFPLRKQEVAAQIILYYNNQVISFRRLSSVGRASALQAEGQRFEPVSLHFLESLAQSVEHLTFNQRVAGSIPA